MAEAESGSPIMRIAIDQIDINVARQVVSSLRQEGINPIAHDSKSLGRTIRLSEACIIKYNQLCDDVRESSRDNCKTILTSGVWSDGIAGQQFITRMEINDKSPDEVQVLKQALDAEGFEHMERDSKDLGKTIRLTGTGDWPRIADMRKAAITENVQWSDISGGRTTHGIVLAEMQTDDPDDYVMMVNALKGEDIDHRSAIIDGRPSVNIVEDGVERLQQVMSRRQLTHGMAFKLT